MGQNLLHLWESESRFLNVLSKVGSRGLKVDLIKCHAMAELAEQEMASIRTRLGFDPGSRLDLEKALLVDLNLPVVQRSRKTDKPSFNKNAMAEYDMMLSAMGNPLAKDILAYRGWQQANSFYYTGYQNMVSPDGRVRPNYKPTGTVTTRLSCELPNLQQIPRRSEKPWNGAVKSLFIPTNDEWVLWDFDYKSLEYRIALLYINEPEIVLRVNAGEDFHQVVADLIYEKTGVKLTRYDAKQMNFAIVYGAGAEKLAYMLKATRDESTGQATGEQVEKLIYAYHEAFPGFRRTAREVAKVAKNRGYIKLWTGRRRHFNTVWAKGKEKDAFNSLCQGGGAEIVKHAMLRLFDEVDSDQCKMVLQVHDSVVCEIRKDKLDYFQAKVKAVMEDNPAFDIKFHVEDKQWAS